MHAWAQAHTHTHTQTNIFTQHCQSKVSVLVRAPSKYTQNVCILYVVYKYDLKRQEMDCANEDSVTWKKLKPSRKNREFSPFFLFAVSACAFVRVRNAKIAIYKCDSLVYIQYTSPSFQVFPKLKTQSWCSCCCCHIIIARCRCRQTRLHGMNNVNWKSDGSRGIHTAREVVAAAALKSAGMRKICV